MAEPTHGVQSLPRSAVAVLAGSFDPGWDSTHAREVNSDRPSLLFDDRTRSGTRESNPPPPASKAGGPPSGLVPGMGFGPRQRATQSAAPVPWPMSASVWVGVDERAWK